jgi:hypothetical protein
MIKDFPARDCGYPVLIRCIMLSIRSNHLFVDISQIAQNIVLI